MSTQELFQVFSCSWYLNDICKLEKAGNSIGNYSGSEILLNHNKLSFEFLMQKNCNNSDIFTELVLYLHWAFWTLEGSYYVSLILYVNSVTH